MENATKYFVFDYTEFTKVNEPEYRRWHEEEWNKYEPPMFSKLIGGIVYTAQAFYHGDATKGSKFKPFTIFYSEGSKHKVFHFRKWLSFKWRFEKLISQLQKKEIPPPTFIKLTSDMVTGITAMTTIAG